MSRDDWGAFRSITPCLLDDAGGRVAGRIPHLSRPVAPLDGDRVAALLGGRQGAHGDLQKRSSAGDAVLWLRAPAGAPSVVGPLAMTSGDGDRVRPDGRHLARVGSCTRVMTLVRWTLVTAGTAAPLGLAVLGWGGWTAFVAHPARVAPAGMLALMAGVSLFADGHLSPGLREDRGNRWVLGAFALLGLLAAYLPAYTDRQGLWTLDGDPLRWLGVGLFAAGGALRLWPVFVLGRRFSGLVAIQPGHTLVTGGIYGVIRHPSSLGLLVNALGWGLAFRAGVGVLLTALLLPPLLARIRAEEWLLRTPFGAAYDAYRARTSRLIPGLY
jgi:protein-S-isoprenylcysteine O-methyltransferase Ste14